MEILLLYFTGTYNTLYITTLIKNKLMMLGHSVENKVITDKSNIKLNDYDMIGIGYPIHAFNAPKIVIDRIKELKISNKKYFIYKTGALPTYKNTASSYSLYKIMKKNKNELMGEYFYAMPSNFSKRTSDEFIRYELEYNYKYVKYMCENITCKKAYKVGLSKRLLSFFAKVSHLGFKANSSSYKIDKDKCIRCRECINNCPTKNIEYDRELRQIVFKDKCVTCMRCSYICPSNAIDIGMLDKHKINGKYDFLAINSLENNFDLNLLDKKEYKVFKAYFDYIDSLVK